MKKIKAVVSGTIQNVGYRAKVIGFAKAFTLTGFVHNLDDGRVQIIAEGEENNLNAFISAIQITNTLIKVDGAEVEYADVTGDLNDFYKLVGGGETDERIDKAAEYLKKLIDVSEKGFTAVTTETRSGFSEMKEGMRSGFEMVLEKQSETTEEIKGLREAQSETTEEIKGLREAQSETTEEIRGLREAQSETTEEIRGLREDMKSYMDRKFEEIESELDVIKIALKGSGILC